LRDVEEIAARASARYKVGAASDPEATVGPMANARQRDSVRSYIVKGIEEGAKLVAGGPEIPPEVDEDGFYIKPTVFSQVSPSMAIAREEIFGPVLSILAYEEEADAVQIANDSDYGLSGAVWAGTDEQALRVARQLRTGMVSINGGPFNPSAPFGGFKQSGHGRELGRFGLDEFLTYSSFQLNS
jgi:acyl-CoA reductase-like NAD-dependent aldehyde dehydrogenase